MATSLPPDPWKALGIERTADKAEIRSAYKKLVLKCHPDKVQDPALKQQTQNEFQKVQEAYELLNNDVEKTKYEQKLKLAELQRAAAKVQQDARTSSNTSVPRTSTRFASYDIRTTEPTSRYKSSPSGGKVYTHYTTAHTRSHEEVPASRMYQQLYEEPDRRARRTASYEKPSKRDEEKREREKEERRLRREEEEIAKLREKERDRERERERAERDKEKHDRERDRLEREKEKDREARKAEKKKVDRERDKDRTRRRKPYVEDDYENIYTDVYVEEAGAWLEDEKYVSSRASEKKRSSSRKHDDTRDRGKERDKSSSRVNGDKHMDLFEQSISYMSNFGSPLATTKKVWSAQDSDAFLIPPAPTPPPLDIVDESIRRSSARAAGRRASNDAARSREKLKYDIDPNPKGARPIPPLNKSYSTSAAPESPPRVSRSQTAPHESSYARPIPPLPRTQTWTAGGIVDDRRTETDYYDGYGSDDDRDRRHRRSSRRPTQSPSAQPIHPTHRYKVEGTKTSKLEAPYSSYSTSPTSTRRYAGGDVLDGRAAAHSHSPPTTTYAGTPFRVKESKAYGPGDVKYSQYAQPSYYDTTQGGELYTAA